MITTKQRKERRLKKLAHKFESGAYLSPDDIEAGLKSGIAEIRTSGDGYDLTDKGRAINYG